MMGFELPKPGLYLSVAIVVIAGSILFLSRSDELSARWRIYAALTCLQKELHREVQLRNSDCMGESEWAALAEQSLTVANLYSQMLLQSDPDKLVALCRSLSCACSQPGEPGIGSLSDDPRSKSIALYGILAEHKTTGLLPELTGCANDLPSSSFIYLRARAPSEALDPTSQRAARTVAFALDRDWSRHLWRAQNALDQAQHYQEIGEPALARVAYERALTSFELAVTGNQGLYLALTYSGLAELYEDADLPVDALGYYERSITSFPQKLGDRISNYVELLYATEPVNVTARLVSLLESNIEQSHELVYEVISGQIAASRLDDAQLILERFEAPLDAHWLAGNGALARARNDLNSADDYYRLALEMVDEQDPLLTAKWSTHLATVRALNDDLDGATALQKQATVLAPDNPNYWVDLARFYRAQDRSDLALQAVAEALKLDPNNAQFVELRNELRNS